jgi:hypothetical protein
MQPVEFFKHFGLASALLLTIGLTFLITRWPLGRHATFSKHAAAQRITIIYYIGLFALALPVLLLFFIGWFVPTFHIAYWFVVFAVASQLLQHAVTIIPETGGWRTSWHRFLTGCSALLLVPMLALVIASPAIVGFARGLALFSFSCMISIIFYQVLIANKMNPRNQLILQTGYYGAFFMALLGVTYIG